MQVQSVTQSRVHRYMDIWKKVKECKDKIKEREMRSEMYNIISSMDDLELARVKRLIADLG